MRKIIKEYLVYKFEELEKDIQEEIMERYIKISYECYIDTMLYDDMVDLAQNTLEKYFKGAEYKHIYYDLSYSQGSGSMVEFNIDLKDLNNKYKMLSQEEIQGLENFGETNIKVYHDKSCYCHEYTFDIDWNDYTDNDNFEKIQNKIDTMIDLFRQDIVLMNKDITRDGYNMLEDKATFEQMAMEHINDLEFLSNGSDFNECN